MLLTLPRRRRQGAGDDAGDPDGRGIRDEQVARAYTTRALYVLFVTRAGTAFYGWRKMEFSEEEFGDMPR